MSLLIKRKLSRNEIGAIPYLLKNYPQLLVSSDAVLPSDYIKYFINSINYFLCQNKKSYLLVIKKREILGMALLRFMEWDSRFFKMPIGCIEYILVDKNHKKREVNKIEKELLRNSINTAKEIGMKILYISVSSERYSLVDTLNSLRFSFVCGEMKGVIRKRDMSYLCLEEKLDGKYEFRKYKKDDYSPVIKIAKEITEDVKSKFSLTPYLPRKEKYNYYLESIKNCCLGLNADDIFVVVKEGVVVGFVCYRYDRIFEESLGRKMSFLVMGGVSQSERRKNVARNLFAWAHRQILKNSELVLWKAYLHNLPMIRFIMKRGFAPPIEIIYTFCKKI